MLKEQIRKRFINKRDQLSQVEYHDLCLRLLLQFQQLDLTGVKCVHTFLPIHKRKEPDTLLIINWLKVEHPDIKIVYPQTNFADHTMQSFIDDADLRLAVNAFDITEPLSGNWVGAAEIDLILLPLLAFDKAGYRVGYGKGFYDRFMAQCRPATRFIGISFFEPVDDIEDLNAFDIKMHACIVPDKIWLF